MRKRNASAPSRSPPGRRPTRVTGYNAYFVGLGKEIQDATDKYNAEADRNAKKSAELEIKLSALRAEKEKLNREAFELAKQVEQGKISRRTAELEIQRATEIVARKAAQSSLTRLPVVVAPPSS